MIIQRSYPAPPALHFKSLVATPVPASGAAAGDVAALITPALATPPTLKLSAQVEPAPRRLTEGEIFTVMVRDIGLPAAAVFFPNAAPSINVVVSAWNTVEAFSKLGDPSSSGTDKALAVSKAAAGFVNAGLSLAAPEAQLARGIGNLAAVTLNGASMIHKLQQAPVKR